MPYLAKEFTEIWWWMVVFQQRSNCLKDNEANISGNLSEGIVQEVCIYTRGHNLPVTLWAKKAPFSNLQARPLNLGVHMALPEKLIKLWVAPKKNTYNGACIFRGFMT